MHEFPWQPATFFAPMEGVTMPPVRDLMARRGGVGVVCTEFVRVTAQPVSRKMLDRHVVKPPMGALSVQVMGNDLAQMAEAAALVSRAGADIIDINLGCPAPRAVRKGVGSAMLKDPELVRRVLAAMRERTALPLSAKIRAGFDDSAVVFEVADAIEQAGVDFLTVHPRRRVDFYRGVADWRITKELARRLHIPVVGNGDLWYAADAIRLARETGCAAVMLGRPALRNPWIFRQIDDLKHGRRAFRPCGADLVEHVHELHAALGMSLPERKVLGMLKEHLRYLGRAVVQPEDFARAACRQPDVASLLAHIEQLEALSASQLDLAAEGGSLELTGQLGSSPDPVPDPHQQQHAPAGTGLVLPPATLV